MPLLSRIASLWRNLLHKERGEQSADEEVQSYVEMLTAEKVRAGMSAENARRAALIESGGMEQVKQSMRDVRTGAGLEALWQDVRYGLRLLAKAPGFTAVAVLTLALGIGANTAIFSVVDGVLLRPLPYDNPDRLAILSELAPGNRVISVAYPDYLDWKAQNQTFENLAAYEHDDVIMQDRDGSERLSTWVVSAGFLPTLGVPVARGRGFSDDDERTAAQVVVLSDGLWRRRFGSDPGILNRQITIEGKAYTVIGVLPRTFRAYFTFLAPPDVLLPFGVYLAARPQDWLARTNHPGTTVVGRLKPGVSLERARADLKAIAARLERQYPDTNAGISVFVQPIMEDITGDIRPALLVLLCAVGAVLLIACTNLANLQIARATSRTAEIAIRVALGARRSRVIRQLLTESVLLAVLGGGLGALLAMGSVSMMIKANPRDVPRLDAIAVNGRVLAFTAGLSLLTGILFGLVPAWQASSLKANAALKEAGRSGGLSRGGRRWGNGLVIAEMALSLLLLISAGLLLRSFARLRAVDPGFNPQGVLTLRIFPPEDGYPDARRRLQFYEAALARMQALPGVDAVGAISPLPLSGSGWQNDYRVEGWPLPENGQFPSTDVHFVTPDYFRVMQIPLRRGRLLGNGDRQGAQAVVVVNETMANRLWPNQDPLGKRFRTGAPPDLTSSDETANPWLTVVGVVGDVHQYGLERALKTEVYFSLYQFPKYIQTFTLRTNVPPLALADPVRKTIAELDPRVAVFRFSTMEGVVASSLESRRLVMILMGGFAGLSMLLAVVGIYGVISYAVSQRTREIGVRMALGARRSDILRMVLAQSTRLVAGGVALGLLAAAFATAVLRTQLFGIAPRDAGTFIGVSVLLVLVALFASYLPARRATRVEPMAALRYE